MSKVRDASTIIREMQFYRRQGSVIEILLNSKNPVEVNISLKAEGHRQQLLSVTSLKGQRAIRNMMRREIEMCRQAIRSRRKELAKVVEVEGTPEW